MVRIGLVGEDPNDTSAIKNLLERRYGQKAQFLPLVKGIKGHHLDGSKIKSLLPIEFDDHKCKFVIYIRDLDAFKSQTTKVKEKIKWFTDLDATVNKNGLLLLNIWELEALIFGDIDTFNKIHSTKYHFKGNPMSIKEPKEQLKRISYKSKKSYKESDCVEIFKHLDIKKLEDNCIFFSDFINLLELKLKIKRTKVKASSS